MIFRNQVQGRIETLNKFLVTCETCDDLASSHDEAITKRLTEMMVDPRPSPSDRVFRHCSIINQLYSIYEAHVESLLVHWLSLLPRKYKFSERSEGFRNSYSNGISRIITGSNRRRFSHLDQKVVLRSYLDALSDESSWSIVPDGFTFHERNLRKEELENLFSSAGLENVWPFLKSDSDLNCMLQDADDDRSLEQLVLSLVTYRNDASHRVPDEILGNDELRKWISYVGCLCGALDKFMAYFLLKEEVKFRSEIVVGKVTETFRDNVSIVKCSNGLFKEGADIYLYKDNYIQRVSMRSLQLEGNAVSEVNVTSSDTEVGIKSTSELGRNSSVVLVDPYLDDLIGSFCCSEIQETQ